MSAWCTSMRADARRGYRLVIGSGDNGGRRWRSRRKGPSEAPPHFRFYSGRSEDAATTKATVPLPHPRQTRMRSQSRSLPVSCSASTSRSRTTSSTSPPPAPAEVLGKVGTDIVYSKCQALVVRHRVRHDVTYGSFNGLPQF